MSETHELTRRDLLRRAALFGGVVACPALLQIGCKSGGGGSTEPAAGACNDLTDVPDAEKTMRTTLNYVAESTTANQNCANCSLIQPAAEGSDCATCQLNLGPISDGGWCSSWVQAT